MSSTKTPVQDHLYGMSPPAEMTSERSASSDMKAAKGRGGHRYYQAVYRCVGKLIKASSWREADSDRISGMETLVTLPTEAAMDTHRIELEISCYLHKCMCKTEWRVFLLLL